MIRVKECITVKTVGKTTGFELDYDLLEMMMTNSGYNPETDTIEFIYREYGLLDGEDFQIVNDNSVIYNTKELSKDKIKAMNKLKSQIGIR